jgi:hypothetical protein
MHEFLNYAQDERLLTDMENQLGYPNYEGFHEHRHDQSILSLLSKKYGLMAFRDPSQFGNQMIHLHPESHYGQLMIATRARNPPPKTLRERFKATVLGRILRKAKRSVEALTLPGKPGE